MLLPELNSALHNGLPQPFIFTCRLMSAFLSIHTFMWEGWAAKVVSFSLCLLNATLFFHWGKNNQFNGFYKPSIENVLAKCNSFWKVIKLIRLFPLFKLYNQNNYCTLSSWLIKIGRGRFSFTSPTLLVLPSTSRDSFLNHFESWGDAAQAGQYVLKSISRLIKPWFQLINNSFSIVLFLAIIAD